ncbi:hypothetical protein ACLMAJ_35695 [Nocardia sp. KC 131]|uniref:hypothetical protein n=1 Tax=Nocardia arseniciresistens TaxID=3392119 RepID=UPI00398E3815
MIGIDSDGEAVIQTERAPEEEPRDSLAGHYSIALHGQRVVAGKLRGMREGHEEVRHPIARWVHFDVVHRSQQMNPGTGYVRTRRLGMAQLSARPENQSQDGRDHTGRDNDESSSHI